MDQHEPTDDLPQDDKIFTPHADPRSYNSSLVSNHNNKQLTSDLRSSSLNSKSKDKKDSSPLYKGQPMQSLTVDE